MIHFRTFALPSWLVVLIITLLLGGIVGGATITARSRLTIQSSAPRAEVSLLNDPVSYFTPHTYTLRPGRYFATVRAPGHQDKTVSVSLFAWINKTVVIELTPKPSLGNDPKTAPLRSQLPYITADFEISQPNADGSYVISLGAVYNRPDQREAYLQQLNTSGNKALGWIRAQGADPATLAIWWIPEKPPAIAVGQTAPR